MHAFNFAVKAEAAAMLFWKLLLLHCNTNIL